MSRRQYDYMYYYIYIYYYMYMHYYMYVYMYLLSVVVSTHKGSNAVESYQCDNSPEGYGKTNK